MLLHEELTNKILRCAFEVHSALGPGLLESVYEDALCFEFSAAGLEWKRQASVPVKYKGKVLGSGLCADIIVADTVLLELKSVEKLVPIHQAQLITYLKLTGIKVGILINFNVLRLRDGIVRRIL